MSAVASLGNGVSGIILGGYVGLVVWQSIGHLTAPGADPQHSVVNPNSNVLRLLGLLEGELGYVEVVVAAGVISLLYDVPRIRPLVGALAGAAIFAALVNHSGAGKPVLDYLQKLGSGAIGLFGESPPATSTAASSSAAAGSASAAAKPANQNLVSPALPAVGSA